MTICLCLAVTAVACGGTDEEDDPGDSNGATSNSTSGTSNGTATSNGTTGGGSNGTSGTSNGTSATSNGTVNTSNGTGGGECGDHALGDTWNDGCNDCTCTEQGALCTQRACVDICAEIEFSYDALIEDHNSCAADSDCKIVGGQCSVGLGGCYASVEVDFNEDDLRALGRSYSEEDCTSGVCDCAPPPQAICEAGQCGFGPPCGEHDYGDTWINDAGCPCVCDWSGETICECEQNSCDAIEMRYEELIADSRTCRSDDACQVLWGQCGVGLGGCYAAVNMSVDQEDLNALGAEFTGNGCTNGVCDCAEAPPVACVRGQCSFVEGNPSPCGDYAVGDTWNDGCNDCTCTEGGPVCTERACIDSCEEIELRYDALVNEAKSCATNDACQILVGQCGAGLGGCYEAVNMSVEQEELNELGVQYRAAECTETVCRCTLPPDVACINGRCEALDQFCAGIEEEYNAAIESASSCDAPSDCQVLSGQCGVGLGGCYVGANMTLSQEDLNALGQRYSESQCTSAVCRCTAPPEVDCQERRCVLVFE